MPLSQPASWIQDGPLEPTPEGAEGTGEVLRWYFGTAHGCAKTGSPPPGNGVGSAHTMWQETACRARRGELQKPDDASGRKEGRDRTRRKVETEARGRQEGGSRKGQGTGHKKIQGGTDSRPFQRPMRRGEQGAFKESPFRPSSGEPRDWKCCSALKHSRTSSSAEPISSLC